MSNVVRLRDLNGRLFKYVGEATFSPVELVSEADRVFFLCPKCSIENNGPVGTHSVAVDFVGRNTPDEHCVRNADKQPVRWSIVGGSTVEDLQLAPSILLLSGCAWHGFIGTSGAAPGEVITV